MSRIASTSSAGFGSLARSTEDGLAGRSPDAVFSITRRGVMDRGPCGLAKRSGLAPGALPPDFRMLDNGLFLFFSGPLGDCDKASNFGPEEPRAISEYEKYMTLLATRQDGPLDTKTGSRSCRSYPPFPPMVSAVPSQEQCSTSHTSGPRICVSLLKPACRSCSQCTLPRTRALAPAPS